MPTKTAYDSVDATWYWLENLPHHQTASPISLVTQAGKLGPLTLADGFRPAGQNPTSVYNGAPYSTWGLNGPPYNKIRPWLLLVDQIKMGDFTPATVPYTAGAGYGNGTFTWSIPWKWQLNGQDVQFTTINHFFQCYATPAGDADQSKGNLGPYRATLASPTVNLAF